MKILPVAILALATGCGTLFAANQKTVQLASNPPGAQITVDGQPVGVTPMAVSVDNHKPHTFVFTGPSGQATCVITSDVRGLWIVLDILAGVLPIIVDVITNDWDEVGTTVCNVQLGAIPPAMPPAMPAAPPPAPAPPPPGAPMH